MIVIPCIPELRLQPIQLAFQLVSLRFPSFFQSFAAIYKLFPRVLIPSFDLLSVISDVISGMGNTCRGNTCRGKPYGTGVDLIIAISKIAVNIVRGRRVERLRSRCGSISSPTLGDR